MLPHANMGNAHSHNPFQPSQTTHMPTPSSSTHQTGRQQRAQSVAPYPTGGLSRPPSHISARRLPPVAERQLIDLLDGPYHPPPSSQPTPTPASSFPPPPAPLSTPGPTTPVSRGRREESIAPPPSSVGVGGSIPYRQQYPYQHQPPPAFAANQAVVDRYRPPTAPPPQHGFPSSQRTAAEAYQASRETKAAKAADILAFLAGELRRVYCPHSAIQATADRSDMDAKNDHRYQESEARHDRRWEEAKEYRDQDDARWKSVEDSMRDMKEQIHELSMGQRVLPTREEMSEEITNQRKSRSLSPYNRSMTLLFPAAPSPHRDFRYWPPLAVQALVPTATADRHIS